MVTLAAQYSKLYTHKFRCYYTDFIQDNSSRKSFPMFTVGRGWEVLGVKVWIRQQFVAVTMSQCNFYVIPSNALALTGEASRSAVVANLLNSPNDFNGQIGWTTHTPNNQQHDTTMYGRMVTNAITGGAILTAGAFDVWVTMCKMP